MFLFHYYSNPKYEARNGIQVAGECVATNSQRFKRNRPATGKWVKQKAIICPRSLQVQEAAGCFNERGVLVEFPVRGFLHNASKWGNSGDERPLVFAVTLSCQNIGF
jgi:hypothetical protein